MTDLSADSNHEADQVRSEDSDAANRKSDVAGDSVEGASADAAPEAATESKGGGDMTSESADSGPRAKEGAAGSSKRKAPAKRNKKQGTSVRAAGTSESEGEAASQPPKADATTGKGGQGKRRAVSAATDGPPKRQSGAADTPPRTAAKRAVLPGPEIKRAAKKAPRKATTQEKLVTAEEKATGEGRRPLDGIRVLDLSRLLPGPYATHILASFGAEVIKIEKPGEGDYMREYQPQAQGINAVFLTINRGKRSLAIDLKHPEGKEAFIALVKDSDVVLDGFRPGVMERLGLGYGQLSEINPKVIYAALTGYGQSGTLSQRAGHDLNYIALAGMLDLLGESNGMPALPGIQIADVAAGALPTVIGILLALQYRSSSGQGQLVDISMFDSLLGLMPVQVANYTATKRRPKRGHERLFGRYACYNVYPVRNGRYVAVAALEPKFWEALCTAINRPDLIEDQYVEGDAQQILKAELTRTFQKKEVSDWMEIFEEGDVCVTEVREISRAVQDEFVAERAMFTPVRGKNGTVYEQLGVFPKLSEAPGYIAGDAPTRGEHTRSILESIGYTTERIDEMIAGKAGEESRPES